MLLGQDVGEELEEMVEVDCSRLCLRCCGWQWGALQGTEARCRGVLGGGRGGWVLLQRHEVADLQEFIVIGRESDGAGGATLDGHMAAAGCDGAGLARAIQGSDPLGIAYPAGISLGSSLDVRSLTMGPSEVVTSWGGGVRLVQSVEGWDGAGLA